MSDPLPRVKRLLTMIPLLRRSQLFTPESPGRARFMRLRVTPVFRTWISVTVPSRPTRSTRHPA